MDKDMIKQIRQGFAGDQSGFQIFGQYISMVSKPYFQEARRYYWREYIAYRRAADEKRSSVSLRDIEYADRAVARELPESERLLRAARKKW